MYAFHTDNNSHQQLDIKLNLSFISPVKPRRAHQENTKQRQENNDQFDTFIDFLSEDCDFYVLAETGEGVCQATQVAEDFFQGEMFAHYAGHVNLGVGFLVELFLEVYTDVIRFSIQYFSQSQKIQQGHQSLEPQQHLYKNPLLPLILIPISLDNKLNEQDNKADAEQNIEKQIKPIDKISGSCFHVKESGVQLGFLFCGLGGGLSHGRMGVRGFFGVGWVSGV